MSTTTATSAYEAMIAQYQKNNASTYTPKENKVEYNESNYFSTYLDKGVNSASKTIRILPPEGGGSPFVEVTGHKYQIDGSWKTFACLEAETGKPCPFCQARKELTDSGLASDKELAKDYNTKKMYVVKLIERGDEEHGPKFWRFNHDYRKTGVFDKIMGIITALKTDVSDPLTGRDLIVNVGRDQNKKPVIQSIVHTDPSPLTIDAKVQEEWLADTKTWKDVFAIKSYEYLEIVVKGGEPIWSKEESKFVDKKGVVAASVEAAASAPAVDNELADLAKNLKPNIVEATAAPLSVAPVVIDDEEDDLPF